MSRVWFSGSPSVGVRNVASPAFGQKAVIIEKTAWVGWNEHERKIT
jgi:hypothetical protein